MVKHQLQLAVENSILDIQKDFYHHVRGIFNPCVKKSERLGLYIRFKVGGME